MLEQLGAVYLVRQFRSIIVVLLVAAAIVAFATRDTAEGLAILGVLLINAAVGFVVEWRSEAPSRVCAFRFARHFKSGPFRHRHSGLRTELPDHRQHRVGRIAA